MTAHMTRSAARKMTIVCLALAIVGVVGVGALGVSGEGKLPEPPMPKETQEPEVATSAPEPREPKLPISDRVEEMAWGMVVDAYQWHEEEAPEVVVAPNVGETPGAPNAGPGEFRYIGSIIGPERRLAIVSVDGRQRILAEDGVVDGYRLQAVEEDHIVVRRGNGAETRVSKAESNGPMVTMIASSGGGGGGAGDAGLVGGDEDNLTQTERLRQQALERQRERLGARTERLDEIERRRNGTDVRALGMNYDPERGPIGTTNASTNASTNAATTQGTYSGGSSGVTSGGAEADN